MTEHQHKSFSLICTEGASLYHQIFEHYLMGRDINFAGTIALSSTEAIKRCAAAGLGAALLPHLCVEEELKSGTLIELNHQIEPHSVGIMLSRPSGFVKSKAMALFEELIGAELSRRLHTALAAQA